MNVYVETNFVMELVLEQEQYDSCEALLSLSETRQIRLILPAFALVEPYWKLREQANRSRLIDAQLSGAVRDLKRRASYRSLAGNIQQLSEMLLAITEDEKRRFLAVRSRLMATAEVVALSGDLIGSASSLESKYDLKPQDALQLAVVLAHLEGATQAPSCFVSRDKDFINEDLRRRLRRLMSRQIFSFEDGLTYVRSVLTHRST